MIGIDAGVEDDGGVDLRGHHGRRRTEAARAEGHGGRTGGGGRRRVSAAWRRRPSSSAKNAQVRKLEGRYRRTIFRGG